MSSNTEYTLKPSETVAVQQLVNTVKQLQDSLKMNDAALQGMVLLLKSQQALEGEWKMSEDFSRLEKVEAPAVEDKAGV